MALFEYFPNYVWNLSVSIALESGAKIGEIIDMCQPLKEAAENGEDAGTAQFLEQWVAKANTLLELAAEDEAAGRYFSAAAKQKRAALYLLVAERMQGHGHPNRKETWRRAQQSFQRYLKNDGANCQRVEIALDNGTMPALFVKGQGEGPRPTVVYCNGLDSCKELLYWSNLPDALARRGISTLCVDQPGTGETLRDGGLPAVAESEQWASKAVDWLEQQPEVNASKIGMVGISLGGHFTPRAVAFEPRFAAGAVWGANHNWQEVQHKRLRREGENPVPHYWSHVHWVFGAKDMDDFFSKITHMNLNGILDNIKVPFLVTHGEQDRQISLDYAHQTYEQLINSPARELKIFTPREGGVEHVGADNMSFGCDYIADWFAETLN